MQYIIKGEIESSKCTHLPMGAVQGVPPSGRALLCDRRGATSNKWIHTTIYHQPSTNVAPVALFTHNSERPEQTHKINYSYAAIPDGSYVVRVTHARTWIENGHIMVRFTCETERADEFPKVQQVARPGDLRLMDYEVAALNIVPSIYTLYIDSYNKHRYMVEVTKDTMTCIVELSNIEPTDYMPLIDLFREIYKTGDREKLCAAPFLRKRARQMGSSTYERLHPGYTIHYENAEYRAICVINRKPIISVLLIKSIADHALLDFPKGGFVWFPNGE